MTKKRSSVMLRNRSITPHDCYEKAIIIPKLVIRSSLRSHASRCVTIMCYQIHPGKCLYRWLARDGTRRQPVMVIGTV
jgi:hypothetical protein